VVTLTLSSQLFQLLPETERARATGRRSVALTSRFWSEAVGEIRERFPRLADQVLTESGRIARGFVLAVNNEVVLDDQGASHVTDGDEICIIVQLAGG
jgi:molybdopterin converting factor small subunit